MGVCKTGQRKAKPWTKPTCNSGLHGEQVTFEGLGYILADCPVFRDQVRFHGTSLCPGHEVVRFYFARVRKLAVHVAQFASGFQGGVQFPLLSFRQSLDKWEPGGSGRKFGAQINRDGRGHIHGLDAPADTCRFNPRAVEDDGYK